MAGGEVEDDRPSAPAIYYPEGGQWILDQIAMHAGSDHLACLVACSLSAECFIDKGAPPDQVAEALRLGEPVATKSRERARELASSIGAEAVGVDIVAATAASVLAYWSSAELPPIPELFLAVTSASLFYPELPERLQKVDKRDLQNSLVYALMSMTPCHKPDEELKRAYIEAMPLAVISAPYAEVKKAVGEVAQLIYLKFAMEPKAVSETMGLSLEEAEEAEIEPIEDWLRIRCYPSGYWELEVDGEGAPDRVAIQIGDGSRYEAPARIPVKSDLEVRPLDALGTRPLPKKGAVLLVAKLGYSIKRGREYEDRLLELVDGFRGKLIIAGALDRELADALRERGIRMVVVYEKVWKQAERGAERLLGKDADSWVSKALKTLLMLYPQMARARGATRSELAEEASRILREVLRDLDDEGYLFLADVVRVMIEEGRIARELIPDRMGKVAETLGLR